MARFALIGFGIAALLASLAGGNAIAQDQTREIFPGETLRGELRAGDAIREDGTYYDVYRFGADAGRTYTIDLISEDFDTFLTIKGPQEFEQNNDDGERDTDARIEFMAPTSGSYEIWANTFGEDHGAYSLSLTAGSIAAGRSITFGETMRGDISASSPIHDDGTPYQPYTFQGKAGQRVVIDMTSSDFDPYLVLRLVGDHDDLAVDDDGGDGTDSRLIFNLPTNGAYEIRANAVSTNARGDFTLSLATEQERNAPTVETISYGMVRRGELTSSDGLDSSNLYFDVFRFTGRSGDKVVVTMTSDDVDSMLYLRPSGGEDDQDWLAEDDDSGDGPLDSRLEFTLPSSGEYEIHAVSFDEFQTGSYVLGLSRQ